MKYRNFPQIDQAVSEIGLGTWQIGGSWGDIDESTALQILRSAYERGVTFFDTADVYGDGRSELIIGKFLKEISDRPFVATKIGRWNEPGWPANFTLDSMRSHINASRDRLGVDSLDLVQLHCIPTDELIRGEVFVNLRIIQREGLIQSFGVSVETVEEGLICLQHKDVMSLQIIFNIFRQKPIKMLFDAAVDAQTGIVVRLPIASGLLSGKMTAETVFGQDDHRNFNKDGNAFNVGETFAGLSFDKGVILAQELKQFVPEGMTMAQMSLRWILDHPAVTSIIPGASSVQQVISNVSASDLGPLSDDLHDALSNFYSNRVLHHIRGPY